ncbi:MAG: cytochrome c [Acidobacteriota bacterium]
MIGSTLSTRRRRTHWPLLLLALSIALISTGCRRDMQDNPRFEAYEATDLFENGMSSRMLPDGTVARGFLRADVHLYQGKDDAGNFTPTLPASIELNRELLLRGQERYEIFCSPCHDSVGSGYGMIVRRGFKQPETFHQPRLLEMPIGYFYDNITNGYGVMSSYASQVPVPDRWAIAAYIRVLQLSQTSTLENLPVATQQAFYQAMADTDVGTGELSPPSR